MSLSQSVELSQKRASMRCPVCWQPVQATWDDRRVQHHLVIGRRCEMSDRAFQLCYPLTVDPKLRGTA